MPQVKFDRIRLDGGTQYRDEINQDRVADYAEAMKAGATLPPAQAVFDGSVYWLVDGFHRYFAAQQAGHKTLDVEHTTGTQHDAQVLALSVNATHGLHRNNATKRRVVEAALVLFPEDSDREISRRCSVSSPFVAAIRSPEAKERQVQSMEKHIQKRAAEIEPPSMTEDYGPDEDELRASEAAVQATFDSVNRILEADDQTKGGLEEIRRLNLLNSQLQLVINGLMTEKNELIRQIKSLEKQLKAVKKGA
jgi:hypothetical protein